MQKSITFTRFFSKNAYLLLIAAWFVTLSFIVDEYWSANSSMRSVHNKISNYIQGQEKDLRKIANDSVFIRQLTASNYSEEILEKLGISMSNAVSIFLRQVVMHNGLPFDIKIPDVKPLSLPILSEAEFNMEMLKAHNDFENGRIYSLEEVEDELKKELGK